MTATQGAGASMSRTVGLTAPRRRQSPARRPEPVHERAGGPNGHRLRQVVAGRWRPRSTDGRARRSSRRRPMSRSRASPAAASPGRGRRLGRRATVSPATGGMTALVRSPLVRRMLETVLADPILLSPEERYLHGHYLAYLLSGSRRRGLFLRRPHGAAQRRSRRGCSWAMTYAILAGATEEAIRDAAALLDQRIDVRAVLSPIVVAKYLAVPREPGQAEALPPDAQGHRPRPAPTPRSG